MFLKHATAILACALTAAAAPHCLAQGSGVNLVVQTGPFMTGKFKTFREEGDSGKLLLRGSYGNFAKASAECDFSSTRTMFSFRAKARAACDAGPKYWIKNFLKDNDAHATAEPAATELYTFAKPVSYTFTRNITSKAAPRGGQEMVAGHFMVTRHLGGDDWKVVRDWGSSEPGTFTTKGTLPAGTYHIYTSVSAEAGWVGGNFTKGGGRMATVEAELTARFDFKPAADSAVRED